MTNDKFNETFKRIFESDKAITDKQLRDKRASRVYEDNRKALVQNVTKGALHELSTK